MREMDEKIISLCYVSKRNDKSTELCRIADYSQGNFVPYTYHPEAEFYGTDRDLLYGTSQSLPVKCGSVGVFEWSVFQNEKKEWRTDTAMSSVVWCELILTDFGSPEAIAEALRSGLQMEEEYDGRHELLLCCEERNLSAEAIRLRPEEVLWENGKLVLQENAIWLEVGRMDRTFGACECKSRYSLLDKRLYLADREAYTAVGKVEGRSRAEVIGRIVRQNIGKDTLGRRDRQKVRAALEQVSMPDVLEQVMAVYKCDRMKALEETAAYLKEITVKLESDTEEKVITYLIENNSEMAQTMRAAVQKEWEAAQRTQIQEAEKQRAKVTGEIEELRRQAEAEAGKLKTLVKKQQEAEEKARQAVEMEAGVQQRIGQHLTRFREEYASFLTDAAQLAGVISACTPEERRKEEPEETGARENERQCRVTVPETIPERGLLRDNLTEGVRCFSEICSRGEMALGLTLLTFAARKERQPLLIAGEGAAEVADLMSALICGQGAIRIETEDRWPVEYITREITGAERAVVCVVDGLRRDYEGLRSLMRANPERMFVVTEEHRESLAMEPESLFTVFFPVFTDYFYNGAAVSELPWHNCCQELMNMSMPQEARRIKDAKALMNIWFRSGYYSPILLRRVSRLLAEASELALQIPTLSKKTISAMVEFLIFPILLCLGKKEALLSAIRSAGHLSQETKTDLIAFGGLEGEE